MQQSFLRNGVTSARFGFSTAILGLAVLGLLLSSWGGRSIAAEHLAEGKRGMVVAVSPPAVEVGVAVLQEGGTAVDAAVAVAFAMAVTWPEAGNIGGGGFMMVHPGQGQEPQCIEYRETAPAAATPDMFTLGESRYTHKIVGTPGTVAGLALAHQKYGKLPWARLVTPAVKLAKDGFALDTATANSLNRVLEDRYSREMPELLRVFGRADGNPWKEGDVLVQADLAGTLEQIAQHGRDGFYQGVVAEKLVAEMKQGGGLITAADLAGYQAKARTPIHGTYRGFDVYGPPPPSSGGICLVEMLNILERFNLRSEARFSGRTQHLMIEAMRRAYLDRARYLGDADFVEIPKKLTSKQYAAELAEGIDLQQATPSLSLANDIPVAEGGDSTTHFSVIDSTGMAVSNTYTLEFSFGSRIVVRGAGFLLNNEMGDFNWQAGYTDRRGAIGTAANLIAPGKRMLSSQTPVIVARDGKARLVTGSPGGRTIINTVLCVVLNTLEYEWPLERAVQAPRLHHQWLPDEARLEAAPDSDHRPVIEALQAMGHQVTSGGSQGDAHSISVDPKTGSYHGVADDRRGGNAAGY